MKKLLLIAAMNIAAIFSFAQRSTYNFDHQWKVFVGDDSAVTQRPALATLLFRANV